MSAEAVPFNEVSDARLVEQVLGGDERAFRLLYHRFARYVAGVIYRLMGNDQDLDDLVQDTFLTALSSLHRLRDRDQVRHWLATIAVRQVYRNLSRRTKRRRIESEVRLSTKNDAPIEERELALSIYRTLDELPPKLRIPWVLHRIEGETLPDTARICAISLATAKRRIAKADGHLKGRLDDEP